ncbi:MAG: hypothetical protein GXZ15_02145 [Campylobacter sp.]|nr:hypothetical protein [Campylobacter sp.]
MVKKLLLTSIFTSILVAASPEQIAINLGGSLDAQNYTDENGNADIEKISKFLQSSGVLMLSSQTPTTLRFDASGGGGGALLMKAVETAIKAQNFRSYADEEFINSKNSLSYTIKIRSNRVPDLGRIYENFKTSGIKIENLSKKGSSYSFKLDISGANLPTESSGVLKPSKPYFINVSNRASITILAQGGDKWHPEYRVFDKDLKVLTSSRESLPKSSLSISLPAGAKYLQVGDAGSLDNISNGLKFN